MEYKSKFKEENFNFENGKKYKIKLLNHLDNEIWNIEGVYNKNKNAIKMKKGLLFTLENITIYSVEEIEKIKRNSDNVYYETPITKWTRSMSSYNNKK